MKFPSAVPMLLLALGCGPDAGVIEPATQRDDGATSFASARYSDWSVPVPLGSVNSEFTDQQPALSKDGLSLYFASSRPTDPLDNVLDQNIWVVQRPCTDTDDEECAWSAPVALGAAVNGPSLEASPSLSRDEHQLFFSSQRPNDHCSVAPCDRDLWVSYREDAHDDFGWQAAVTLPGAVNSIAEEVAPSYFENADAGIPQLFFNRGAVGGDIWVSEMRNGVWDTPSLVGDLNTGGTDQRPSISHNGLEIYFYSDRDGANHLYVSRRASVSSPSWSTPVRVFPDDSQESIMPFIHSQGRTETLLFVRPFALAARDLWITERTRLGGPE